MLKVRAFGLACGIVSAFAMLFTTWWLVLAGGGGDLATFVGRFYFGYSISWLGGVLGAVYGFVDGLIGAVLFAWLYNRFAG
jgi:hypothetical protein